MGILGTLQDAIVPSFTAPGYDPGAGEGETPIDRIETGATISYATTTAGIQRGADITTDIGGGVVNTTTNVANSTDEIVNIVKWLLFAVLGIAGIFVVSELLDGIGTVQGE